MILKVTIFYKNIILQKPIDFYCKKVGLYDCMFSVVSGLRIDKREPNSSNFFVSAQ